MTTTNREPDAHDVALVRAILSTLTPSAAAALVAALVAWCQRLLTMARGVELDAVEVTDEALVRVGREAETAAAAIVGALFCRGMHETARAVAAGPLGRWTVGADAAVALRALRAARATRARRAAA